MVLAFVLVLESTHPIVTAGASAVDVNSTLVGVFGVAWMLCGVLVAAGFLTPFIPAITAIVELEQLAASQLGHGSSILLATTDTSLFQVVIAFCLALIGPGAYSLDSRMFGRREIVVPTGHLYLED